MLAALSGLACGDEEACTSIGCAQPGQDTGTSSQAGAESGGDPSSSVDLAGGSEQPGELTEVCNELVLTTDASPVNVLILLDRSTSMNFPVSEETAGSPSRWEAMTSALLAFVNSERATEARVGLQFFGLDNADPVCDAATYRTPAVPIAPLVENRLALTEAIMAEAPGSQTPTEPAVQGALEYALEYASLPENADRPTLMVLASDGIPTQCGPLDENGNEIVSFSGTNRSLRTFSQPELDESGEPVVPAIRTYVIGTSELAGNANQLAESGSGQAFLLSNSTELEAEFLDALLSIVVKPFDCQLDVPSIDEETGDTLDYDKIRVSYVGASSGRAREFPRARGPADCGVDLAWYYDNPGSPEQIVFCPRACEDLGAGELIIEQGCSPELLVR